MAYKRTDTRTRSKDTQELVDRLKEQGIDGITDFLNRRAQGKGFESHSDYQRALDAKRLALLPPEIAEAVRKSINRKNIERGTELARQAGHKNRYQHWRADVERKTR